MGRDELKRLAARHAAARVEDGMQVGLGTGSTARYFLEQLAERVRAGLRVRAIPTSLATEAEARALGIPLTSFADTTRLDLAVDGADEIDPSLRLIKGAGGALLHEKVVLAAATRRLIIADESKEVEVLGARPLPVEVIPFGWQVVAERLRALGAQPRLRPGPDGAPYRTEEGNHLLDCRFGSIAAPEALAARIHAIPGVVEHGLFLGLADLAIVAGAAGIRERTPVLEV
jgi:ribose 5-phosphate isomerase A